MTIEIKGKPKRINWIGERKFREINETESSYDFLEPLEKAIIPLDKPKKEIIEMVDEMLD